jgi:predicted phage terminase large subunit-like protein
MPIDYTDPLPNLNGVPLWLIHPPLSNHAVEAIGVLHARGKILRSLVEFSRKIVGVEPALHHRIICDAVDAMFDDKFDVLVVMSPPASAKSTYISVAAPAYIISRDPTARIISDSRAAELAADFGGRVKAIVESEELMQISNSRVATDTRAKDNWKTTEGGGYFAVGAAGGVLGKRADWVICDDVHSSFEDAQSETQLEKLRNWFESDLLSRLTPTGKLIIIGQRLNANDIIGFVQQRAVENPAIRIKVLKFSAVCNDPDNDPLGRALGERMWPEFYTDSYLDDKRRDDFIWRTLWMQEPPSEEGEWVSADCVSIVEHQDVPPSAELSRYVCIDLALSINRGDYTVFITLGVDSRGDIYVLDAWRTRAAVDNTADKLLDLVSQHKPQECLIDDDNAAKVYMQLLADRGRARAVVPPMKMLPMRGQDKETRAAPLRALFRGKRIRFVRAQWNSWLLREVAMFPNATGAGVDDGVDALGLIGRRLSRLSRPSGALPPSPPSHTLSDITLDGLYDERARTQSLGRRRF